MVKEDNKVAKGWRTTAIVFIILFVASWTFIGWGMYLVAEEQTLTTQCYYDVCEQYPEAFYDSTDGVCTCYDYDENYDLVVMDNEIIG